MQELHLVGFTTDRRNLILSTRQGAESGSFVVPIDDDLLAAVAHLVEDGSAPGEADEAGDDTEEDPVEAPAPEARAEAKLSVREVQARLRSGEPIADIAADAAVEPAWVERFAPPVWAEQQQVVAKALATPLERPRQGRSAVALREAVARAMAERDVSLTAESFAAAWRSRLVGSDLWAVEFHFRHRGRDRTVSWTFDAADQRLTTSDRFASQIGFVPGADADQTPADRAPTDAAPATKEPAATKPKPRKSKPRKSAAKKRAAKKPAVKKRAVKKPAAKKPTSRKPAAKKSKPKKSTATKSTATKKAGEAEAEAERDRAAAAAVATAERKIAEERKAAEQAAGARTTSPPSEPTALVARLRTPEEKVDPDDLNGRTAARRARTAARTAPTAQFRSGAAVPAADAPPKVNGAHREPVRAEPSDPEADARRTGGRRPRRARQLRAR